MTPKIIKMSIFGRLEEWESVIFFSGEKKQLPITRNPRKPNVLVVTAECTFAGYPVRLVGLLGREWRAVPGLCTLYVIFSFRTQFVLRVTN